MINRRPKHQYPITKRCCLDVGLSIIGDCLVIGIWVLMVGFCAACAGQGHRAMKELRVIEGEHTLRRAVRELDHRMIGVRSIKGVGTLTGSWMGREGTYQFISAVRWPTDLRIDLLDPAVGTVASLTIADGVLAWYLPLERRVYRGAVSAKTVARATRLHWSAAELTGLLSGLPPMEYGDRFTDWWLGPDGFAISPDERALLSFLPKSILPDRYLRFSSPERRHVASRVEFGDYRAVKGYLLPHMLRMENMSPKTNLELVYESIEVNAPIGGEAFIENTPDGTQVIQLR